MFSMYQMSMQVSTSKIRTYFTVRDQVFGTGKSAAGCTGSLLLFRIHHIDPSVEARRQGLGKAIRRRVFVGGWFAR